MAAELPGLERRWLRTPQAAEALGIPAKTLNTWVARGALDGLWLTGPNQWKRFSLSDLAALCLAPELSAIGVPPHAAAAWGAEIFRPDDIDFRSRGEEPEAAYFADAFRELVIAVLPDADGGHRYQRIAPNDPLPPARRFTLLRAGPILSDCFDRAFTMTERPHRRQPPVAP